MHITIFSNVGTPPAMLPEQSVTHTSIGSRGIAPRPKTMKPEFGLIHTNILMLQAIILYTHYTTMVLNLLIIFTRFLTKSICPENIAIFEYNFNKLYGHVTLSILETITLLPVLSFCVLLIEISKGR